MSCGSKSCTPTEFSQRAAPVKPRLWLARVALILRAAIDREQRRQLALELEKARERGQLKHLDDRQLADLGITREQADEEAHKSFWR